MPSAHSGPSTLVRNVPPNLARDGERRPTAADAEVPHRFTSSAVGGNRETNARRHPVGDVAENIGPGIAGTPRPPPDGPTPAASSDETGDCGRVSGRIHCCVFPVHLFARHRRIRRVGRAKTKSPASSGAIDVRNFGTSASRKPPSELRIYVQRGHRGGLEPVDNGPDQDESVVKEPQM